MNRLQILLMEIMFIRSEKFYFTTDSTK
jgi:hypothetical protein